MNLNKVTENIFAVLTSLLLVGFVVAFVGWSKTWNWQWYGYTMFYCGVFFIPTSIIYLSMTTNESVGRIIVELIFGGIS